MTLRLVLVTDEVEGAYHPVATRFEAYLAPRTSVLVRAAGDGIDAPRRDVLGELGVAVQALCGDLPARQAKGNRTLRHVGLLAALLGGVCLHAERVQTPDPLGPACVV